jgi:hypothetical protein
MVAFLVRLPVGTEGWFNDFHSYWLAGRLVAGGASPFDTRALEELGRSLGLSWVVGGGYSYPLPFAIAMVPLSSLPFGPAIALFTSASAVALVVTLGWWLDSFHADATPRRITAAALVIGAYPPVAGSLFMGQANLLVLGLLVPGIVGLARRPWLAGIAIGLAGAVKLVPLALSIPLALAGRWRAVLAMALTAGAALAVATIAAPVGAGGGGGLAGLFEPDAYWSNQSINGLVSRLFLDSDRTAALAPHLVSAAVVSGIAEGAVGIVVLAILVRSRRAAARWPDVAALAIAFALATAVLGAPKDSFWNHVLALPAVGVLFALVAPRLEGSGFDRTEQTLLTAWFGLAVVEGLTGSVSGFDSGPLAGARTLLTASGVASLAGLCLVLGRRLVREVDRLNAGKGDETLP